VIPGAPIATVSVVDAITAAVAAIATGQIGIETKIATNGTGIDIPIVTGTIAGVTVT
jgi:hypothetical protein